MFWSAHLTGIVDMVSDKGVPSLYAVLYFTCVSPSTKAKLDSIISELAGEVAQAKSQFSGVHPFLETMRPFLMVSKS